MPMQRLLLCWMLMIIPLLGYAAPVDLLAMQIQPSPTDTHIIFILSKKTTGKVKYVPDQHQLIVTFTNTRKHMSMHNARLAGANVSSMDADELPNNVVKYTFTVQDKITWKIHFLPPNANDTNVRLQLDVTSAAPSAPLPAPNHPTSYLKPKTFVVVIDAGHGGKDPGAKGRGGLQEKAVVLAIANRLAQLINQTPHMHAVLTRNGDYYVTLRKRLKLARKHNADLFISIHADAFYEDNARGASIYALSRHGATSEAARWLAQKDHYAELDDIALNDLQDRSLMVRSVLIDLAQTVTTKDSLRLGSQVLSALDHISSLHYQQVEQAPFVVLKSPDIPSILIETGFITNPYEEHRLANPSYQQKLASAIHEGIQHYLVKGVK